MLDLGCGKGRKDQFYEQAGLNYVGLDHDGPDAQILGDAHALPFANNSIDFIISLAVLEHVRYPFLMLKEACRVLKPGGMFLGTVSFLEPFHSSFYHFSSWGILNALVSVGFEIDHIVPDHTWTVYWSTSFNLFPRLPRIVVKSLAISVISFHKLWWKLGNLVTRSFSSTELNRLLLSTGAFSFLAHKPLQDLKPVSSGFKRFLSRIMIGKKKR